MPDIESLLGEIAALREMVAERDVRLAELASVEVQLTTARLEIEHMKLQLAPLRRHRRGRSGGRGVRGGAQ